MNPLFKRGFLIASITVILLYFILPIVYIDPVRWWDSIQNAEGHIQFIAKMMVTIVISIPVGIAIGWWQKTNSTWIKGFVSGLITAPILLGLLILAYILLNIAP